MSPSSPQNGAEHEERISALVNEFFERRQAGENVTPESFAAEHPDLAEELRPYLAGLPLIDKACTLRDEGDGGAARGSATGLPAVEGYQLIEEIGRGGMGIVYKALQVSTARIVALKVMLAGPFASPAARRRFEREVKLSARLQHPDIVRVLESGRVAEQPYYAMDYVAGVRLDRYLAASQPDVRVVVGLFARVCEALDYAHAHGVVHRDLKPANVLIDEEGHPHVLDFGLAKATDQADTEWAQTTYVSLPGQVVGTLSYLSPEQAVGAPDEIDGRTDVYALGVMLFEALTGSLPFDTTGRPSQVIQRILETAPASPSSLSERVDAELEALVLKALEKEKGYRYQSAREMAEDLRRYLEGEPLQARRPSGLYVLRKKLAKHRWRVGVAAVLLVVGLAGLAAGLWRQQRDLARARRSVLGCQESMEGATTPVTTGLARTLWEQYPELPEVGLVWAQAQYRGDQRDHAIHFLESELRRDPSRWACRALLVEMYREAGDAERADALRAQAAGAAPDTAQDWYLRSLATLDLERARHCAQQTVEREPAHALAWRRLAHLCLKTGELEGALRAADRLIALGEDAAHWTFFKGQILARQGRFWEAIEHYGQMVTARPQYGSAYCYRAHAYRRVKQHHKAVEDYTRALELGGEVTANVWYMYQRATVLWIVGRTDEALEDCRRFRILWGRPWYSEARRFLMLHEQGRAKEAEEVLAAALRDVEERYPWLRQVFRCLAGQLTVDELVAEATARENREQLCEAYYYAGEVCLLSNQLGEARKWFELCVRTGVEFDLDTFPLTPMSEYELAQWRLESLPADVPTSGPGGKN